MRTVQVESFVLGPMMTNCYLLYQEKGGRGVVVDPGSGPEKAIQRIQELELVIEAILLTHAHFDHIGGLEEVRSATGAPVWIHERESDWLEDPNKNGSSLFPGVETVRCRPAEKVLKGGEELNLLGETFTVTHTPGHSPGSISFLHGETVFSGDVLFAGGIGRTDLPGGDYDTLMRSIHDYMMELPEETIVYSGHGPVTTIGREQDTNPFVTGMLG